MLSARSLITEFGCSPGSSVYHRVSDMLAMIQELGKKDDTIQLSIEEMEESYSILRLIKQPGDLE